MEVDNQLRPACLGCSKLHACLSLLVLAVNFGLGQSTLMSDQSIPAILERIGQLAEHTKRIKPAENDLSLYEVRSTSQTTSPLTHEIGREGEVFQAQNPTEKCKSILKDFQQDFSVSKAQFTALLHTIKQQENLEEKACLKQIVGPSEAASLNPPELGIVKSSVDLHFGAFWMWDKVGRILLQNPSASSISKRFWSGVPPPLDVGDVVKVLGVGSTVLQQEEYTVAAVHGTAIAVEKDGVYLDFPRDRLILTIGSKYISIADSVLRNEIKDLNEDDPSILQDMEEIFKIAAVREAFQKTQQTGDPRHLQNAMKASETFHFLSFVDAMRELPSIEATPLQKPGKGKYKPDPAETSSIYTSEAAVRAFEVLQLIRGHTVLEGCRPLTHRNLYGTGSELVWRVIENAKFEALNMQGQDVLYAALENQCRSTAAFVFPAMFDSSSVIIPQCVNIWKRMRNDWSQMTFSANITKDREALTNDCSIEEGQLAPGYLSGCDSRCMEGVLKRDYPFGKRHAKRKSIGRDSIIAGDVARITIFSAFDTLPYLDLVGGQIWRLAHFINAKATIASIEEEFEVLSCVIDALTKDVVDGLHVDTTMAGFGLPHLQLLALNVATDLRHHASVVGANLKNSKKLRTAAKGSKEFSAFFRLLSCHVDGDTEALHAQFGPFASLAIRIALFLRVEVEEHANKGWKDAISVFTGKAFNRKLYEKVVRQMRTNATKFIEKFMGEFSYVPTGKLQNVKKGVKRLFKRKRKTNARAFKHKIDHKVGHIFAKLMLMMWTNGSKHQIDSGPTKVDSTFRLARQFQTYTILNHGMDPVRPIIAQIKKACKETKVVKHKHWSLLSRSKGKVSGLVNEVETSLAYGLITGHTLSAISEAGRELAAACHEQAPLDLTTRETKYRLIAELHQCMELRGQAVKFLKLALKNVKSPPEEVTARLFTFLKQILAIRGKDAKALYKAFLRWQKEGESSREVNQWNDNMDMLNCSWHSSQEEQNHILSEAGKRIGKEATDEVNAGPQIQTCRASYNARLDLQQAQVNIFSAEVVQATSL